MKKLAVLMAGVAAVALTSSPIHAKSHSSGTSEMGSAPAAAPVSDPRVDELSQRVDALEAELQQSEMRQSADHEKVDSWKAVSGWWDNTSISGRMYYDITDVSNKHNGAASGTDGFNFDVKRFYVGIDHTFNKVFSADITTDVTYDGTTKASQVFVKKAFLQAKLDDAFIVRVGSADMPWIPFAEDVYGYRFVENTLSDRAKFGTSADWGVHVLGKYGIFNYQVSAVSGAGYKTAFTTAFRPKHPDVEGRVGLDYMGLTLAVGGYWGDLGAMKSDTVYNDATRFNAIAAYKFDGLKVGVEFFTASNWNNVKSATASHATGFSPFASYQFTPEWSVFGRYDYVKPYSEAGKSAFHNDYFNIGINYEPTKIVDFALVYKNDAGYNGSFGDQNGTIGGTAFAAGNDGHYNEIGLFGQLRW
jgi:hypothetical protein